MVDVHEGQDADAVTEAQDVEVSDAASDAVVVDARLLRELSARARTQGLRLTGDNGLLARLTRAVIEGELEGELDAHLGYAKHDPAGRDGGNSRNGHRPKTVLTMPAPSNSTCRATATGRSRRRSCPNANAGCRAWMTW